ncbi:MAG: hypothetical protein NZ899_04455 [Thermoguttaceae bacterium]|nr:hypothetical protein [Thermoguttaceae bacterium]MDW8077837.1 DUF6580 family putative transport protein [Thermoguttaceae bacterium]
MQCARLWVALGMILAAAAARLLPHPPNLTPIGAMALFGGAAFSDRRVAFGIPLAAMFLSDVALGLLAGDLRITFHPHMPFVYLAFAIQVVLGMVFLRRLSVLRVGTVAFAGALQFFVLTNFAVWAIGNWYPKTWAGLAECYVAALPFFQNQLIGDLGYSAVLFGAWALAERFLPAAHPAELRT